MLHLQDPFHSYMEAHNPLPLVQMDFLLELNGYEIKKADSLEMEV